MEDDSRDSEFDSEVGGPRVEHVGEDAIGGVVGDEFLHFVLEEVHTVMEFGGFGDVFGEEVVFVAFGEADFFRREGEGVGGDGAAGGDVLVDGFLENGGVGRGGDDGDTVAAGGEEAGHFEEWDQMSRC